MEPRAVEPDVSVRMWKLETEQKAVVLWVVLIYLALKINISEQTRNCSLMCKPVCCSNYCEQ